MANTRNMRALETLLKVLENPQRMRGLVARSVAEEAVGLVRDGFRTETDPYGARWRPKVFPDGRKVLSGKTSRLKNGWKARAVTETEIRITPSVNYAEYHQRGTGVYGPKRHPIVPKNKRALAFPAGKGRLVRGSVAGVPARMMVPDGVRGLPPSWSRKLDAAATEALAALLGADGRRVSGLRRRLGIDALVGFKVG